MVALCRTTDDPTRDSQPRSPGSDKTEGRSLVGWPTDSVAKVSIDVPIGHQINCFIAADIATCSVPPTRRELPHRGSTRVGVESPTRYTSGVDAEELQRAATAFISSRCNTVKLHGIVSSPE